MDSGIQIVDPTEVEPDEPVPALLERTVFRVGGRRLILLDVEYETSWHRRSGDIYGWVRTGRGHIEYDSAREDLEMGDFLYVPADTLHRFTAGQDPFEMLAVVDGMPDVRQADRSGSTHEDNQAKVVGPDELVSTVESPDLVRETPFPDAEVLLMRVRAAGGAAAGWHHHGDNVYFGYAVDGPSETEYGSTGGKVARIDMGECFHVPSKLIHRDTNPTDETHTGIIWLCGGEPWVVNVDSPG